MKRATIVFQAADRITQDQLQRMVSQVTARLQGDAAKWFPDGALTVGYTIDSGAAGATDAAALPPQ